MKDSKETYFGALIESIERRKKIKHFIWGIVVGFIIVMCGIMMSGCEFEVQIGSMDDYRFDDSEIEVNSVEDILIYISNNITYKNDINVWKVNEYWQLPEETYMLKTGDCEDFCILFMYLCKVKLNVNSSYYSFENLNIKENHAFVKIEDTYYDVTNLKFDYFSDIYIFKSPGKYLNYNYSYSYGETMWLTYYYHKNIKRY